jgi:hypothetical protein
MSDITALLGGPDELLDGRIGEVEQRAIRQGLRALVFRHLFLLRRHVGVACHESPQPALSLRRVACCVADSPKGRLRLLNTSSAAESWWFRT